MYSIFLGTRLVTKKPRRGISFLHEFIRKVFVFLKNTKSSVTPFNISLFYKGGNA